MDFLNKLDDLMDSHGFNKHTLSMACGIPYTTIDAWYKKGYGNAKLSTIQKLADFFGVTIDYLMREEITDINYGLAKNTSEPDETGSEAIYKELGLKIYKTLLEYGYVSPRQDLTEEQINFLDHITAIISAYFND